MWRAKMTKKAVAAPIQNAEIFIARAKIVNFTRNSTVLQDEKIVFYALMHDFTV